MQYKIEAETFTGRKYYRVWFKSSQDSEKPNIVEKEINMKDNFLTRQQCKEEIVYLKVNTDLENALLLINKAFIIIINK